LKKLLIILAILLVTTPALALQKNVAGQVWGVFCFTETDNTEKTGLTDVTGTLYLDAVSNSLDYTPATELASGFYAFTLTQAETNADYIIIAPTSATASIQCIGSPPAVWTVAPNHNTLTIANNAVNANVKYVGDDAITDNADGRLEVNVEEIADVAVSTTTAQLGVNVVQYGTTAVAAGDPLTYVAAILVDTETTIPATITTAQNDLDLLTGADGAKIATADPVSYSIAAILIDTDLIDDGTSGLAKIATDVAAILVDTGTNGVLIAAADPAALSIAAILNDTDDIGVAGAGLTNIDLPNQTMDIIGNITGNLSGSVGSLTGHTAQTGDSYSIVTNATYGLSALNTDIDNIILYTDGDGSDGIDADIAELMAESDAATLTQATINGNVSTILGQTGTTGVLIAAADPVAVSVTAILVDTAAMDTATELRTLLTGGDAPALSVADGSGFTAVPWNVAWDAQVQSEADDALRALGLHELIAEADAGTLTDTSIIGNLMAIGGDVSDYSSNTDSLEALAASSDPMATAIPGAYTAGTAGYIIGTNLDAKVSTAADPMATAVPGAYTSGTAGYAIGTYVDAPISTVDTVVDGIATDVIELKAESDASTLTQATIEGKVDTVDTVVDAIKLKTDRIRP